jgi:hypothetical protein
MKNKITTEVSEIVVKHEGNAYRANQIHVFRDGERVGTSYVDCALIGKWPNWLQDETAILMKLTKVP